MITDNELKYSPADKTSFKTDILKKLFKTTTQAMSFKTDKQLHTNVCVCVVTNARRSLCKVGPKGHDVIPKMVT